MQPALFPSDRKPPGRAVIEWLLWVTIGGLLSFPVLLKSYKFGRSTVSRSRRHLSSQGQDSNHTCAAEKLGVDQPGLEGTRDWIFFPPLKIRGVLITCGYIGVLDVAFLNLNLKIFKCLLYVLCLVTSLLSASSPWHTRGYSGPSSVGRDPVHRKRGVSAPQALANGMRAAPQPLSVTQKFQQVVN